MNIEQYKKEIQRTWQDDMSQREQLSNAALGLVSEVAEYRATHNEDELGDAMYYAHMLAHLTDAHECIDRKSAVHPESLEALAALIAEGVKKTCYHHAGESERSRAILKHLKSEIGCMVATLNGIADERFGGSDRVRAANIAKLRARYPDGFVPGGGVR